MKEIDIKCFVSGIANLTITVPENATEEDIYSEAEYNLDIGNLDPDLTDIEIEIVKK